MSSEMPSSKRRFKSLTRYQNLEFDNLEFVEVDNNYRKDKNLGGGISFVKYKM